MQQIRIIFSRSSATFLWLLSVYSLERDARNHLEIWTYFESDVEIIVCNFSSMTFLFDYIFTGDLFSPGVRASYLNDYELYEKLEILSPVSLRE